MLNYGDKMTMFSKDEIEVMRKDVVGRTITDLTYESDGDYFVIEFEGGAETSVRFMADIAREISIEHAMGRLK